MKPQHLFVLWGMLCVVPVFAQVPLDENGESGASDSKGFKFSLIPTAFQKNPEVRFNVITEMTEEGRKVPVPTLENPAYYLVRPMGYVKLGQDARKEQKSPPVEVLMEKMQEALAANGYVPATDVEDPISLIIIVDWGLFSGATMEDGQTAAENSDEMLTYVLGHPDKMDEWLHRASLVGGARFAATLRQALLEEENFQRSAAGSRRLLGFQQEQGGPDFMDTPLAPQGFRPIVRFRSRNEYLFERSFRSFYFVIASAFDQKRAEVGERVLLWQTKMTVDADGVAMAETLNPLILSATPYFGQDMTEPARVTRRIDREGSVVMEPIEVIETLEPAGASRESAQPVEGGTE